MLNPSPSSASAFRCCGFRRTRSRAAENGSDQRSRQALRILRRSGAVDLLITDQMMPGIRGTQLIEAVRSEWPDLRVILATGYAETPSGSDDVPRLNKPFMQQDLARAIASIAREQDEAGRVVPFRLR